MRIFDSLKHFTVSENWGNAEKMNGALLITLDIIRDLIGKPIIIHCGYEESGHSENSHHFTGNAVDFHISEIAFVDAIEVVKESLENLQLGNFCGLGIYPDWNNPGFHLDLRGKMARWGRLGDVYVTFQKAHKVVTNRHVR